MSDEKRRSRRYEVNANAQVADQSPHRIVNISLGGICLRTSELAEMGTILDLQINFHHPSGTIATRGEVVWRKQGPEMTMGVRFVELNSEHQRILRRYLGDTDVSEEVPTS